MHENNEKAKEGAKVAACINPYLREELQDKIAKQRAMAAAAQMDMSRGASDLELFRSLPLTIL